MSQKFCTQLAQLPPPLSGIDLGCIVDGTVIQYCKKTKKSYENGTSNPSLKTRYKSSPSR